MDADVPGSYSLLLVQLLLSIDGTSVILLLLLIFVLLLISGLISGSEVAFFSLSKQEINNLSSSNEKRDLKILRLIHKPDFLLSTILITNNLVNVGIIVLSYFLISNTLSLSDLDIGIAIIPGTAIDFVINILAVTFILVLFGEIAPKIWAKQNNMKLARVMSGPLLKLRTAFFPISYLLVKSGKLIKSKVTISDKEIDIKDIDKAIDISTMGQADEDEVNILKGVVKFGNTTVKQIMRARGDIVALERKASFNEVLDLVKDSGYSRIPVYSENLDTIFGVLYVKDLLIHLDEKSSFKWNKLCRAPSFVPENKKIDDLLREIQDNRIHLAIVVDEYGGTSGLVTLEDIVEEVVGEIKDEHDDDEEIMIKKLNDQAYYIKGKIMINDLCRELGIDLDTFDEIKGDADSLGGLIINLAGEIPEKNTLVDFPPYHFEVKEVASNRIEEVKMTVDVEAL